MNPLPVILAIGRHTAELPAIEAALIQVATVESATTADAIRETAEDLKNAIDKLAPVFADLAEAASSPAATRAALANQGEETDEGDAHAIRGRLFDRILGRLGGGDAPTAPPTGDPAVPGQPPVATPPKWDGNRLQNLLALFMKFGPVLWPMITKTPWPF